MRTELLKDFVTLADCGTVATAAEMLYIDQSYLRKKMQVLEKEYGVLYVTSRKNNSKITLTPIGKNVYDFAKNFLQQDDILRHKIKAYQKNSTHYLCIAVVPGLSEAVLEKYILPLKQQYPDFCYELIETNVKEQEQLIINQIAELGLSNSAIIHPESFSILFSKPHPYHLICNKHTRHLDTSKAYSLKDLENVPLCLTINSGSRIEKAFEELNIIPKIVGRSSLRQTTSIAAALDLGVAIYPAISAPENPRLIMLPLQETQLYSEEIVYTTKEKSLSPIAKAFLKIYKAQ